MDDQQQNSSPQPEETPKTLPQPATATGETPPSSEVQAHKSHVKKPKLPLKVKVTLLIFALVSGLVLTLIPNVSNKTANMPSFWILLSSGLIMIAFTALLFSVLNKLNLGFGKIALVMAFGYNAVIAIIKFVISPRALYLSNQSNPFNTQDGNPNTFLYYLAIGLVILLLYIGVFRLIYGHFRKRIEGLSGKGRRPIRTKDVVRFIIITVALVIFGGSAILIPLLFIGSPLSYLGYVFGVLGLPLLVAVGLGIFMAYKGFAAVEKQIAVSGNTALLASFLWLGVSLIILYHILWVVFMLTLVHIWPFKTYSPK